MLSLGLKLSMAVGQYTTVLPLEALYFSLSASGYVYVDDLNNWYTDAARTIPATSLPNQSDTCYFGAIGSNYDMVISGGMECAIAEFYANDVTSFMSVNADITCHEDCILRGAASVVDGTITTPTFNTYDTSSITGGTVNGTAINMYDDSSVTSSAVVNSIAVDMYGYSAITGGTVALVAPNSSDAQIKMHDYSHVAGGIITTWSADLYNNASVISGGTISALTNITLNDNSSVAGGASINCSNIQMYGYSSVSGSVLLYYGSCDMYGNSTIASGGSASGPGSTMNMYDNSSVTGGSAGIDSFNMYNYSSLTSYSWIACYSFTSFIYDQATITEGSSLLCSGNMVLSGDVSITNGGYVVSPSCYMYGNSIVGSGGFLSSQNVVLYENSSVMENGFINSSGEVSLYDYSYNAGTIYGEPITVNYPSPNPIGGITSGTVTYQGYA